MEGDDLCSSKVKNKQPYPASALAERPPMKGALNEDILYCHSDTWKALRKTMMRYVYEGLGDFCYPKVVGFWHICLYFDAFLSYMIFHLLYWKAMMRYGKVLMIFAIQKANAIWFG